MSWWNSTLEFCQIKFHLKHALKKSWFFIFVLWMISGSVRKKIWVTIFTNMIYLYSPAKTRNHAHTNQQGLIPVSHWDVSAALSSSYHAWSPRCYCKWASASLTFTVRPLSLFWIGSKTNQKCHFCKILLKYFEILEPL